MKARVPPPRSDMSGPYGQRRGHQMKVHVTAVIAALVLLAGGCASGPSPEVMELMRQNAELKQANEEISRREIAEQAQQKILNEARATDASTLPPDARRSYYVDKNGGVHYFNDQPIAPAPAAEQQVKDAERKQAEMVAYLNKNPTRVAAELTKELKPASQKLLEAYGFKGTVVGYDIDDAQIIGDTLYIEQLIAWEKSDSSGGGATILSGQNINTGEWGLDYVAAVVDFTPTDLASVTAQMAALNGDSPPHSVAVAPVPVTPSPPTQGQEPSFYQRNQPAIENAGIQVAAKAATAAIAAGIAYYLHILEQEADQATQEAAP